MEEKIKMRHRYYIYSINIGPLCIHNNSKIYDIKEGRSTILPGLIYSIITILLGWWSINLLNPFFHVRKSLEALHVNFTGGEDITKLVSEDDFDDMTNFVWNNLLKTTSEVTNRKELEKVFELHEEFLDRKDQSLNTISCTEYIRLGLSKFKLHHLTNEQIVDIIDTVEMYINRNIKEKEIDSNEINKLLVDLNLALEMLADYEGGYSNQFFGVDEFYRALSKEVDLISKGKRDFSNISNWFAPTCSWDDFVGMEGIDLANKIFTRVNGWEKEN